jgi:cysteine desulfurase
VFAAMTPYLTVEFGNPSSSHAYGRSAHCAMDQARAAVAALIGAAPPEIVSTGSGSEADALAIRGTALAAYRALEAFHDVAVTYLPVESTGRVDLAAVAAAITPDTVLVSIMHANNETGTIQPIAEIAVVTRAHGALLHNDAAQSSGKITVSVDNLGVDLLTGGGGRQEHGLRAGTGYVAKAVGLGEAADLARQALAGGETARLTALRDQLEERLHDRLPDRMDPNGRPTERLPNIVNVHIAGAAALGLLAGVPPVAASAGSACHAGHDAPFLCSRRWG